MASAAEIEKECCVCSLVYISPKLFPCHHSLCEACVNRLQKNNKIECPTCRTVSDVSRLVHDFRLEKFLEALKEQENEFARIISGIPKVQSAPDGTSCCELCEKNTISFYCIDCEQWICSDCKTIHQRMKISKDHHIEKLSDNNSQLKKKLQAELQAIQTLIEKFRKCTKSFTDEIGSTKAIQLRTLKDSKQLRAECILDLHNRFDRIDADILSRTETQIKDLEKKKAKYDKEVQDLESEFAVLDKNVKAKDLQLALDGQKMLKQAKDLLESIIEPSVHIERLNISVLRGNAWKPSDAVTLTVNGGMITQECARMTSTMVPTLGLLANQTLRYQKYVSLPKYPRSLRLIKQQLWQCHSEGITIYSQALEEQRRILCGDICDVYDVAMMPDDTCVVAASNGLFHIKPNGIKLAKVDGNSVTAVAVHGDHVYTAIYYSNIRVYDNHGIWRQRTDSAIQCEPGFKCIAVNSRYIMVSYASKNSIDVFSFDGTLQFTLGKEGNGRPGELEHPYICCNDNNDMVLIADNQNHRFQIVNSSKKWQVLCLDKEVRGPIAACYTGDKLFAVSYADKTLSMFQ